MKKIMLPLLFIPTLFLVGCEKNYTVKYFDEHSDERIEYLKKCGNGDVDRNSQNCENARISNEHQPMFKKKE